MGSILVPSDRRRERFAFFHDVSAWDMTAGTTVSEEYKSPVSFCPQILITYCWLSFGFLMRSQTAAVSTGFC
jgi:hypothetical protein